MADSGVYDRWHRARAGDDEPRCREHAMVASAAHLSGDRWQARWRDQDGAQRKANFARKADAARHAATVVADTARGTWVNPADGSVTLRDFAEDWRATRTHDRVTAGRIERQLRIHVYPVIGGRTVRELGQRPSLMRAWISGLQLGPASARQVIRDLSSVFLAAKDDGLIARNPLQAQSVTRPKAPEVLARPWTLDQVDAMAAELPPRFAVLPYLGAGAGMRQGELFGLAAGDVDFLRHVIHVRRQVRLVDGIACFSPVKNGKSHDVPLAGSLAPVLAEHIRLHPPVAVTLPWRVPDGKPVTFTLLVTRPDGTFMHRTRFGESHWRPALVRAGIVPGRTGTRQAIERGHGMHVLRHTAASAWLSAGVGIPAVAAWLGDTEVTVLSTYSHLMPDDTDRGRKAMDRFFARSAPDVPSAGSADA